MPDQKNFQVDRWQFAALELFARGYKLALLADGDAPKDHTLPSVDLEALCDSIFAEMTRSTAEGEVHQ